MNIPRFVKLLKEDNQEGNVKEYEWDEEKIFVEKTLQDDVLMLQNVFEGNIISPHVYPLIFEKKAEKKEASLRSLEFYREVEKDNNFLKTLSGDDKLFFLIGLRDLYVASTTNLLDEKETKLLRAMVDLVDSDGEESLIQKRIGNLLVTPYPTFRNKVVKFISSNSETPIDEYFIRNELGLVMVFADPGDLSYHNFENIINLNSLFDKTTADNFIVKNFKKQEGHEIYTFDLQDKSSVLLSLDKYGLYIPPFNKLSRGGQRFIFSSEDLSKSLTTCLKKQIPDKQLMNKKFRFVNYVFRYNKFKPSDSKFSNHYDTPYHDPQNNHYSKYTIIFYLTPGTADPVLSFDNGKFKIDYVDCKEGISAVIFDQKYEHEGKSFFSTDKIFLRSELVFEYNKDELTFDDTVSKRFNIACYMTKQSVFNPELEKYASECFDQAAKSRLNISHLPEKKEENLYKLIFKRYKDAEFITNGYDYWFNNNISLTDAAIYLLMDYFNCTFDSKTSFNKLSYNKIIEVKAQSTAEILKALEAESTLKMVMEESKATSKVPKRANESEDEDGDDSKEEDEEKDSDEEDEDKNSEDAQCCDFHCFGDFDPWSCEDVVSSYKGYKHQAKQEVHELKRQFNITICDETIEINKDKIKITDSLIIFDTQMPKINFAACWNAEHSEDDYIDWDKKEVVSYTNLPSIPYTIFENGYHLRIEHFNNKFVRRTMNKVKYPTGITDDPHSDRNNSDEEDEDEDEIEEEDEDEDEDEEEDENDDNSDS